MCTLNCRLNNNTNGFFGFDVIRYSNGTYYVYVTWADIPVDYSPDSMDHYPELVYMFTVNIIDNNIILSGDIEQFIIDAPDSGWEVPTCCTVEELDDYYLFTLDDDMYNYGLQNNVNYIKMSQGVFYGLENELRPAPGPTPPEPTPTDDYLISKLHNTLNAILGLEPLREEVPLYRLTILNSNNYVIELTDSNYNIVKPIKIDRDNTYEYRLNIGLYYLRCYKVEDDIRTKVYYEEIYVASEMMSRPRTIQV
jgi:hypothetical protein